MTHWGLSGPAILRLSAWGARELHDAGYRFTLVVNWVEPRDDRRARADLEAEAPRIPRRHVAGDNPFGIPARLWERLVAAAAIAPDATWASLSNDMLRALALQATASEFAVAGKSMNKEEFVTCGGVSLAEVDMATMESRICPGPALRRRGARHRRHHRRLQLPGSLDDRLARRPRDGGRAEEGSGRGADAEDIWLFAEGARQLEDRGR